MDIMAGLTAASKALEAVKLLQNISEDFKDAEFKLAIADLTLQIADMKHALADARGRILELEGEVDRLSSKKGGKMPVQTFRGYSFGIDENGESIGRPFCPVCEKKDDLQIQLVRVSIREDKCPACKADFSDYPWRLPKREK